MLKKIDNLLPLLYSNSSHMNYNSMCYHNSYAIFKKLFPDVKLNYYYELNKYFPENTIGEKINKQRLIRGLQGKDLAKLIKTQTHNIWEWESGTYTPAAHVIKRICTVFNLPLEYFDDYYKEFYDDPVAKLNSWLNKNNLTLTLAAPILNISYSTLWKFQRYKVNMSYDLYTKLKLNNIINI